MGAITIAADLGEPRSLGGLPTRVVATLTLGTLMVRRELAISGNTAFGTIDSLLAGTWRLDIAALDAQGDQVYYGKTNVEVRRDQTTSVSVTLRAESGSVRIEACPAGIPGEELICFADISIHHASGTSPYRVYPDIPKAGGRFSVEDTGYVPRSYDMQVAFKTSDGTVVYTSEYVGFGVVPGKTTDIFYSPGIGDLQVSVDVDFIPPAPRGVCVAIDGTRATVTWSRSVPADGDLASYRVYWRYSVFDRYSASRSESVDATETSVSVGLSSQQRGSMVYFVVVARDSAGQDSLRSEEVSVFLP
jgi:hypothetical protein